MLPRLISEFNPNLTPLNFGRLFGMSAQTWMNLQTQYDLEIAENELGDKIDQEVMPIAA